MTCTEVVKPPQSLEGMKNKVLSWKRQAKLVSYCFAQQRDQESPRSTRINCGPGARCWGQAQFPSSLHWDITGLFSSVSSPESLVYEQSLPPEAEMI